MEDLSEAETVLIEPSEPVIVIEPIMFFDMGTPAKVVVDFISPSPVQLEFTLVKNERVIEELTKKGYKLISTEKQGTLVYGIFQK